MGGEGGKFTWILKKGGFGKFGISLSHMEFEKHL
jgi:hypothetical protein